MPISLKLLALFRRYIGKKLLMYSRVYAIIYTEVKEKPRNLKTE